MKSIKPAILFTVLLAAGPLLAAAENMSEAEIKEAWECAAAAAGSIQIYEDEGNAGNVGGAKFTFHWWEKKLGRLYREDTLIEWVKKIQHARFEEIKDKAVACNRIARELTAEQIAAEERDDRTKLDQQRAEAERRQSEQAASQARQRAELEERCARLADSSTQLATNVYENAMDTIRNPPSYGWSGSLLSAGCSGIHNAMNEASRMGCSNEVINELQRFYNQYYISLPSGGRVDCR